MPETNVTGESSGPPRVLIVGAGFGGLEAARRLGGAPVQVTVVDRRNYHLFQPLLYQVATAALNPGDIAAPARSVLRHEKNVEVMLADVRSIDARGRRVVTTETSLAYDFLVLATGATHSYFGHEEWAELAPGLKTVEDALEIRRRILLAFERAEYEPDPAARKEWLTFVVVGGGPTGVELAGAISEIARHTLTRDFRHLDPRTARVLLIEGAQKVLPGYVAELSDAAKRQLEQLGVEVRPGAIVTEIDEGGVRIGQERIAARTVLWGAGVAASPLTRTLGVPLDRAGRVIALQDLTVPGYPEISVVGDVASVVDAAGKRVPGVAPAAIQEGAHVARCIRRTVEGQPRLPFVYRDKGSIATIGRAAAVAQIGRFKLTGFVAWMTWLFVHIFFLIGFRNRFAVLFSWAYSYWTFRRSARLITDTAEQWRAILRRQQEPRASGERRHPQDGAAAQEDAGPNPA